jgi:hypothetical protein
MQPDPGVGSYKLNNLSNELYLESMFIFVCALKCRGKFLKQKRDNVIMVQNEQRCRMLEYKIPAERINVCCISGQTVRNVIMLRCYFDGN